MSSNSFFRLIMMSNITKFNISEFSGLVDQLVDPVLGIAK